MLEQRLRYLMEKRLSGALSDVEQQELYYLLNELDQREPANQLERWEPVADAVPARRPIMFKVLIGLAGVLTVGMLAFNVWLFFYMYEKANSLHESVSKQEGGNISTVDSTKRK